VRPLDLAGKLGAPFDEPAHDEGVHGFIQPFCSRSHGGEFGNGDRSDREGNGKNRLFDDGHAENASMTGRRGR